MTPEPVPSAVAKVECMCAEELARFLGVNRKTVYEYAALVYYWIHGWI